MFPVSDRFGAPVIGAEIVEYDPIIITATKGMSTDGSPLYSVFARNRRQELLSHLDSPDSGATDTGSADSDATGGAAEADTSKKQPRGRSDRSVIDWDHKFDDDPPPF